MFKRGGSKERGGGGGGGGARPLTANSKIFGPEEGEPTYPCKVCGRKFVKASLQKHQDACKRLAKPKRKPFESGQQRAGQGSDIGIKDVLKVKKEIERGNFQRPKTNWRERHEEFQSAVCQAKGVDTALKTGAPLPPPAPGKIPSDYVKCEYCGRSFNRQAADRHIPHCERKFNDEKLNNKQSNKPPTGRQGGGRPSTKRGDASPGGRPRSRRNSAEPGVDRQRGHSSKGAPPTRGPSSATEPRRRGSAQDPGLRPDSRRREKSADRSNRGQTRNGYGDENRRSENRGSSRHNSRERRR